MCMYLLQYPRPPSPYDRRRRDDRRHSRERYRSRSPPPRDYRPRDRSPPPARGRSRDGDRAMRDRHDDRDYRRWRESPPRERRDYRLVLLVRLLSYSWLLAVFNGRVLSSARC